MSGAPPQDRFVGVAAPEPEAQKEKNLHLICSNDDSRTARSKPGPRRLRVFIRPPVRRRFVAEQGQALSPRSDHGATAPRCVHRGTRADRDHRRLHRRVRKESQAVHLDRQGERHPREGRRSSAPNVACGSAEFQFQWSPRNSRCFP